MTLAERLEHLRDSRAEYRHARDAHRSCDVHRSAIVADEQIALLQQSDHLWQADLRHDSAVLCFERRPISPRFDEYHDPHSWFDNQGAHHFGEPLQGPAL